MKSILPFFLLFSICNAKGQTQKNWNADDCERTEILQVGKYLELGNIPSPKGPGQKMEFKSENKNDSLCFEKEHNSAWYKFKAKLEGELIFKIIPNDTTDNYNFLFFRYDRSDFCSAVSKGGVKPIRTNLSNNIQKTRGETGLSLTAKKEFISPDGEDAYSVSIKTKPGEQYYLIIDKVNESKGGYKIIFSYPVDVEISGTVTDENEMPIKAEITLTDPNGDETINTETDSLGKYGFHTSIDQTVNYSLTYYNDTSFIQGKVINTNDSKDHVFKDLKTVLPKLRGGKKYVLGNINFYGDSPKMLPSCQGSLDALYKLMKRNRRMIIQIEGYVNVPGDNNLTRWDQNLSDERAEVIYDFLVSKGIDKKRMTAKGFGNTNMIYPYPHNDFEMEQNRRVEINVIKIK